MQAIWFLTISLTLHVTVLGYFVAVDERRALPPIAVTILPMAPISQEEAGSGHGDGKGGNQVPVKTAMKPAGRTEQRASAGERPSEPVTEPSIVEVGAKAGEASVAHTLSSIGEETLSSLIGSGTAGKGGVATGNGSGTGSGNETGSGSSPRAVLTAPARYSETPKPAYPDAARRAGREGRVLLRVLIDERGETKAVEVSRSSGSDALDHAATSAIKRWRFHPARSGDQPIESWVSVPIDFRLTDTKN